MRITWVSDSARRDVDLLINLIETETYDWHPERQRGAMLLLGRWLILSCSKKEDD